MAAPVTPAALARARNPQALVEARQTRGWSQEELAAVVGCTYTAVSRWESGARTPDPVFQVRLVKALRLHLDPQPVSAA